MNDITKFNKLAELAMGGQKIGDVKKLEDGILFLCGMQIETTACIAFAVGGFLTEMKSLIEHGKFLKFIEGKFPFNRKTANKYMRLYEHFKDDPGDLKKFGLRQALIWAGIIKPKERKTPPLLPDEHYDYGDWKMKDDLFSALFAVPPLNENAKLQKYRFRIEHGEICIVEKNYNQLFPIASIVLFGEGDARLNSDHREVMQNIQRLLEKYYEKVEYIQQEDAKRLKDLGIISRRKKTV